MKSFVDALKWRSNSLIAISVKENSSILENMTQNPIVTVVVPVYMAEKYIRDCIKSCINQTYENIRILLVNDCSPDNSLAVCEELRCKYPQKINIIDKPVNEGVDKARFSALHWLYEHQDGGYITFLDADDWMEKGAIEAMVDAALSYEADIVNMRFYRCFSKYFKVTMPVYVNFEHCTTPKLFDEYFKSFFGCGLLYTYMCGKLYRLDLLKSVDLSPSKFRMCEDHVFNMQLFPYVKSWVNISYKGYNYRYGGATSRYNPLWPELRDQSVFKRQFADRYGYLPKVKTLLDIELKNIFYSDVVQRMAFCSEEEFNNWIESALNDEIWAETVESANSQGNDDFNLIYQKDIQKIKELAVAKAKVNPMKKFAKAVLKFIFFR